MSRHYVFSNASDPWVQVIQFQWAQAPFDRLMARSTLEGILVSAYVAGCNVRKGPSIFSGWGSRLRHKVLRIHNNSSKWL